MNYFSLVKNYLACLIFLFSCIVPPILLQANEESKDTFTLLREKMVEEHLKARNIRNEAVLKAMQKVPRHKLVPREHRQRAYDDRPLPIGYGQTISQPYIVAYMTEVTRPQKDYSALEIGTGSGYQAAILAEIVSQVYSIEIVPALGERAKRDIEELDYDNIAIKIADGYHGWEEFAPFDIIIVTAASEHIPPPLIEQLKDGGRMVIPVGSPFLVQTLMLVEKEGEDIKTTNLMPVRFVPFTRSE